MAAAVVRNHAETILREEHHFGCPMHRNSAAIRVKNVTMGPLPQSL
jgi:hypothetical protein